MAPQPPLDIDPLLARLTGEDCWRKAADLQFSWLAGSAEAYPAGHSFAMLACLEELWPTAELMVTAQETPEELRAFLRKTPHQGLTVLVKTLKSSDWLVDLAPFTKEYSIPTQGARYCLCRGGACSQPVDNTSELGALFPECLNPNSRKREPPRIMVIPVCASVVAAQKILGVVL